MADDDGITEEGIERIANQVSALVGNINTEPRTAIESLGNNVGDIVGDIVESVSSVKGSQDMGKDLYIFENKSDYCDNCGDDVGVEIDGFLFFPEEVSGNNTYSNREYIRTKIMSGGEFVTRGQYQAREFSFKTTLTLDPSEPYMYDKVFQIMENKPCEIVSPQMGDNFKAEVSITKTHPKGSPSTLLLDVEVKEIVDPKSTLYGDEVLEYPSTTVLSDNAIEVKAKPKPQSKSEDELELEQISYGWLAKDDTGRELENKYD